MKLEHLERAFESIGARFQVTGRIRRWPRAATGYEIDIGHDRRGPFFALRGDEASLARVELALLNKEKGDRHLLLLIKDRAAKRKDRFLCGHDEREWFVAAVPGSACTVSQAKEALKPPAVRNKGLSPRKAQSRHNAAFRRQGEWFFVPVEQPLTVDPKLVLRNEPISRGNGSKPHLVEKLFRTGGETVFVCARHPNGLTASQYERVIRRDPAAKHWRWQQMRRNPGVFAMGTVRHPDHATIVLPEWCEVLINEEHRAPSRSNLAFLD